MTPACPSPVEIERRFLVEGESWLGEGPAIQILQAYLSCSPRGVVRVRVAGDEAFLTIKGPTVGIRRNEFEYAIPVEDARALVELREGAVIQKTRHRVTVGGKCWEVDVFEGPNAGLVVAEIELESEDENFDRPPWLGPEVSALGRFQNAALSRHPYCDWSDEERRIPRASAPAGPQP